MPQKPKDYNPLDAKVESIYTREQRLLTFATASVKEIHLFRISEV